MPEPIFEHHLRSLSEQKFSNLRTSGEIHGKRLELTKEKKFMAGMMAFLGILTVVGGLSLASDPSSDMFGTMAMIAGLLLCVGAWWLWPSTRAKTFTNRLKKGRRSSPPSDNVHDSAEEGPPAPILIRP